jgi:spermidine synthase
METQQSSKPVRLDAEMPQHRGKRFLLALVVMFLGGCGLVYEYVLSTLATHLLGNSIEQFSLVIATMLFAMGISGLLQKRLDEYANLEDIFIIVELCLAMLGAASPFLLYLGFGYLTHFHLVLYGLAFAVGFLIGLEIPLLIRMNTRWRGNLKDNLGDVLSLDYVGALIGALIWAFILLPKASLVKISLLLASLNVGVAMLSIWLLWDWLKKPRRIFALTAITILWIIGVHHTGPKLIESARQHLYASPIQYHEQSRFQDIVFTGQGHRLSLYLNGHLQFDSEDEYIYHEMLVHPAASAVSSNAQDALVLGGGDGLAVREILKWPKFKTVTLVDLDARIIDLAKTYPPLTHLNEGALLDARIKSAVRAKENGHEQDVWQAAENVPEALNGTRARVSRVKTAALDADGYLRDTERQWDLIVADFPDPSTPDIATLFSLEFFLLVKRSLKANGVFVVQSSSPYANRGSYWTVHDTLIKTGFDVVPLHAHVPTFGEWGWHIASMSPIQFSDVPQGLRYLTRPVLEAATVFPSNLARPPGGPRVSTRLDPLIMRHYLQGEPIEGKEYFPGAAYR